MVRATEASDDSSVVHQLIGDPERKRLLVVDDEEAVRAAISRFLRSRGYVVQTAASADQALEHLAATRFAAMICDVRMPGMSGIDLLPRALEIDPDLAIMMLTGLSDNLVAAQSLLKGAGEYLVKPVELGELLTALERVIDRRFITVERRNVERLIADEVNRRLIPLQHDRDEAYARSIESLALAVSLAESRNPYFSGTSARVAALSRATAEVLTLSPESREDVANAARLHDVGRLAIPDAILNKREPLTTEERAQVLDHVRLGLDVLSPLLFLDTVLKFVRDHHERFDGSGYPHGQSRDQISIGGRILSAADAFVALTSRRAYRDPLSPEDSLARMSAAAGSHFDPAVFLALETVVTKRHVLGLTAD